MDPNLYIKLERDLYDHDVPFDTVIREAYRAGADGELDAVIDVILSHPGFEQPELFVELLRAARRPSLKELALEALKHAEEGWRPVPEDCALIRRALEALPG